MSHDLCHLSDNNMSDHALVNPIHDIMYSLFAPLLLLLPASPRVSLDKARSLQRVNCQL